MPERLIGLVAAFAFAIGKATEINGVLKVDCLWYGQRSSRIGHDCVTDVAVVANHLTSVANVLAIMTAKTA